MASIGQTTTLALAAKAVGAAILDFESRTGWEPFLSTGADTTRYFDPPGKDPGLRSTGGRILDVNAGLLSVTTLTTGITFTSTGTALVAEQDFILGRYNAAAEGYPYDYVEFRSSFWLERFAIPVGRGPKSISIAGRWGYCSSIPDDAYTAILFKSAMFLAQTGIMAGTLVGAVTEKHTPDFGEHYASVGGGMSFWESTYADVARGYRRISLG